MRKHWFILALFLAYSLSLSANGNNIWHFGRRGGLNLNQPMSTPAPNSAMNIDEGPSTCDSDGLLANITTTQPGLIVPHPDPAN